ncbi:malonate decarboxylase holo-ACP synthase [Martelella alba]|uniref:Malonate decarboxylase holo-ACP synthase n=1 Tax=Martelella alba TaxID=2590451 RepID=A0ABY2SI49_9HYPH|nr:malonate decarboxylase holo-ACP synthase [Martelella alba]TKI05027.1 malonate decarboxylase holo-ACP synthase [Martelella alba]
MHQPEPHDLLWLGDARDLSFPAPPPDWVTRAWSPVWPVVVRRDRGPAGFIPVGIRGAQRRERVAAWVAVEHVRRVVTPEMLVRQWINTPAGQNDELPVLRALRHVARQKWPWAWGVTGSCGYMLATGIRVCRADSDLDLLIRCPRPLPAADAASLAVMLPALPCRADIQLETPLGGCALVEWLRGGKVMVKTATGPLLTDNPWPWAEQSAAGHR